jgi:heterodisulfide reductase subunit C2
MTIRIKKSSGTRGLIDTVREMSDVDLNTCFQCKKCSSGCTVTGQVESPPSEIIRRLHLGAGDELLSSDLIWTCVSCETCYARCPMGIDTVAVMDALRALAVERKAATPRGNIPLFNRSFLRTVNIFGRTHDLGLMAAYRIGTSSYLQDSEKVPMMLKKRKIAILPSWGGNRKIVRRIFKKVRQSKGTVR